MLTGKYCGTNASVGYAINSMQLYYSFFVPGSVHFVKSLNV